MILKPDLVVFDCDGVLIDSEVLSLRNEVACLTEHGFAMSAEEIRERYSGISAVAMFADVEMRFARKLPDGFAEMLYRRNAALFDAELEAMPGIAALLDRLACPVCVASSSEPERLRHTLGLVGLHDRFAPNIFSAMQVANGKPAPDLFLFAAAEMAVAPAVCLVIEDSVAGVRAGVAAGMTVLGFTGGGHLPARSRGAPPRGRRRSGVRRHEGACRDALMRPSHAGRVSACTQLLSLRDGRVTSRRCPATARIPA